MTAGAPMGREAAEAPAAFARAAHLAAPIGAGEEPAAPATRTVAGAAGAGTVPPAALVPGCGPRARASARVVGGQGLPAPLLDTGRGAARESLDLAGRRLGEGGAEVRRASPADAGVEGLGAEGLTPAAAAALLLCPVVREVALPRGRDPDRPSRLSKVTRTP